MNGQRTGSPVILISLHPHTIPYHAHIPDTFDMRSRGHRNKIPITKISVIPGERRHPISLQCEGEGLRSPIQGKMFLAISDHNKAQNWERR